MRDQRPWAFTVLLLLASCPLWLQTLKHVQLYREPDTRTEARFYLDHHLALGAKLYLEPQTFVLAAPEGEGASGLLAEKRAGLGQYQRLGPVPIEAHSLEQVAPDYVLLLIKPRKGKGEERVLPYPADYYHAIAQQYGLVKIFSPYPLRMPLLPLRESSDFLALYQATKQKSRSANRPGPFLMLFERTSR